MRSIRIRIRNTGSVILDFAEVFFSAVNIVRGKKILTEVGISTVYLNLVY
jgi:hypothetical protein